MEQSVLLSEALKRGEHPGDAIPGYDGIVYKARRNNRAVPGGERKGYRFIYCIRTPDQVTLLSVYAKTEQENISDGEIAQLLKDVDHRLSGE